jgi:anti-anti-sigma factor
MKIEQEHPSSDHVVLRPTGRVDVETAPVLRERIKQIAETPTTMVVVDLKSVEFIDSSGLSALVSGLKALRQVTSPSSDRSAIDIARSGFSHFPECRGST